MVKRTFLHRFGIAMLVLLSPAILPVAHGAESDAARLAVPPIAAPVIDGRDSSADEWRGACTLTGWADSILGIINADQTIVDVGHHGNTLYIRMVYPIPEAFRRDSVFYSELPLKKDVTERDGDIRSDDYLGFQVSPGERGDVYFFGVNAANTKRDSRNGDAAWSSDRWKVSQTWDHDSWRVEFSLPLDEFPASESWGINFVHAARRVETVESVWTYQPAQLTPLARMRLAQRKVAFALGGFGDLGNGSLKFAGRVSNHGDVPVIVRSSVAVTDVTGDERKAVFGPSPEEHRLQPGATKALEAGFDAPGSMYGDVTVRLKDDRGNVLLAHRLPFVFSREIRLEARYIPTPELLQLKLFMGAGATAKFSSVTIDLVAKDSGQTALTRKIVDPQQLEQIEIDCRPLAVGSYDLAARVKLDTDLVTLHDRLLKEPQPEWVGNKVGISHEVPEPWTALTSEGRTISCWGRDYRFGAAGFPARIDVQGSDILAGPVRVSATVNGRRLALNDGRFEPYEESDTKISFKTVATAGPLSVEADTWMEFDGFVWNTITFDLKQGAALEAVTVEIPFRKQYATLWWTAGGAHRSPINNSAVGAPPQTTTRLVPENFLRLGDEEHGLQFCHESFHGWNVTQTLIPGTTDYVLRYDARSADTASPRSLSLGYMALPCKPRSPYFRQYDFTGWSRSATVDADALEKEGDLFQVMPYSEGWNHHYNYFNFWNEDVYDQDFLRKFRDKWKKQWEEKRHTFTMYINSGVLDANTPEYRKYRFEWQPVPGKASYVPPDPKTKDKSYLINGCTSARSSTDFTMWYLDRTVKYLSEDGAIPVHAYIDCYSHHNKSCSNTLHDCPQDGAIPVLATREYLKRIYTIYKSVNPINQVVLHNGGENSLSAASFTDIILDGEQFRAPYYSTQINDDTLPNNYTRILDLERVRSLIQTYAWGPERYHLYQFWKWTENEPDNARPARAHLWALMFSHDVPCWSAGTPANIPRAIRELGWDEKTQYIPYWRKGTGIELTTRRDSVVASAWRRGDANALVMIVNDSDAADTVRLKIDYSRFGFEPGSVTCRDYGAAGLGYPDSIFLPEAQRREPPHYMEPEALTVDDAVVEQDADISVAVNEHSYRLLRLFQD